MNQSIEQVDQRIIEVEARAIERRYAKAFLDTINENTAFSIAMTEYYCVLREIRGAVSTGGNITIKDWLISEKIAAQVFDKLNTANNKAKPLGFSLEKTGLWAEATQIVSAINEGTENGNFEPLRALVRKSDVSVLKRILTESGKPKRGTVRPLSPMEQERELAEQWIGDQIAAVYGLYTVHTAAEMIKGDLETERSVNPLAGIKRTALDILTDMLKRDADYIRQTLRRLKKEAEDRQA